MAPKLRESVIRLHKTGHMQLAIDSNEDEFGKQFYSCGLDDSIAKWEQKGDSFESDVFTCNNFCGNIAVNRDVYVGETITNILTENEENVINKYDATTKIAFEILKFSMPISALDVSPNGSYLIAASKDYTLKFTRLNQTQEWYDKKEFDGIPVSITISPSSEAVAVGTSDGFITMFSIEDEGLNELQKIKVISPFNKTDDLSSNRMKCAWHPIDSQLYLPSSSSIVVISTKEWKKDKTLDTNGEEVSILCITSKGEYLAAYTVTNKILVYQTAASQLLSTTDLNGKIIVSMIFDPENDKTLILADSNGMMHIIENATTLKLQDLTVKNKVEDDEEMDFDKIIDDFGDDDKDFNLDDDDDIGAIKSRFGYDQSSSRPVMPAPAPQIPPELLEQLKRPVCTVAKMQPPMPFISGSTPLRNGERFLKWNTYGQIRVFEADHGVSTEIEYHDSSIHAEIILNDQKFIMGDLNNYIIALASESELYVRIVNSLDLDNRVWTLEMPEVGAEFVAVFTRERYIRIFTASGTQRAIFSVETPVVTMAANENMLVLATVSGGVIVHSADSFEHQIHLDMYEINALGGRLQILKKLRSLPVALSPESSIKWLSFTSFGQICTMDSDFVVRLLSPSDFWVPIFEGSIVIKSETNGFWPIAILDTSAHLTEPKIRYLLVKGNEFPLPSKNLAPITVGLSIPLCNKEATKTKDENDLILNELMFSAKQLTSENMGADREEMDKLVKKHLQIVLKLFSNAVVGKKENRAAEFIDITHGQIGVNKICQLAAKIANKGLSDKLTKVAEKRFAVDSNKPRHSTSLYAQHDNTAASKRTIKRKTITTIQQHQQNEFDYGQKSSKISRKSVEDDSQDIYIEESQMETDEREPEISFSAGLNDSSLMYSMNESRLSVSSPCNPFKKNTHSSTPYSTAAESQDFFSTLTSSVRSTEASTTSGKTQGKKVKITQSKLAFGNKNKPSEIAKENVPQALSKPNAFDFWRKDNDAILREEYEGEDEKGFMEFAVRKFRLTDKEEKAKYKEMAAAATF
uniref:Minichromosome loss protein Mcl1 middle region domain-containing protein n=1 Tax=Panagrolaimus sp. PS1159 TaxID=55785 RepID=A0AC35GCU0_9BILA